MFNRASAMEFRLEPMESRLLLSADPSGVAGDSAVDAPILETIEEGLNWAPGLESDPVLDTDPIRAPDFERVDLMEGIALQELGLGPDDPATVEQPSVHPSTDTDTDTVPALETRQNVNPVTRVYHILEITGTSDAAEEFSVSVMVSFAEAGEYTLHLDFTGGDWDFAAAHSPIVRLNKGTAIPLIPVGTGHEAVVQVSEAGHHSLTLETLTTSAPEEATTMGVAVENVLDSADNAAADLEFSSLIRGIPTRVANGPSADVKLAVQVDIPFTGYYDFSLDLSLAPGWDPLEVGLPDLFTVRIQNDALPDGGERIDLVESPTDSRVWTAESGLFFGEPGFYTVAVDTLFAPSTPGAEGEIAVTMESTRSQVTFRHHLFVAGGDAGQYIRDVWDEALAVDQGEPGTNAVTELLKDVLIRVGYSELEADEQIDGLYDQVVSNLAEGIPLFGDIRDTVLPDEELTLSFGFSGAVAVGPKVPGASVTVTALQLGGGVKVAYIPPPATSDFDRDAGTWKISILLRMVGGPGIIEIEQFVELDDLFAPDPASEMTIGLNVQAGLGLDASAALGEFLNVGVGFEGVLKAEHAIETAMTHAEFLALTDTTDVLAAISHWFFFFLDDKFHDYFLNGDFLPYLPFDLLMSSDSPLRLGLFPGDAELHYRLNAVAETAGKTIIMLGGEASAFLGGVDAGIAVAYEDVTGRGIELIDWTIPAFEPERPSPVPLDEVAARLAQAPISGVTVLVHGYRYAETPQDLYSYFSGESPGDELYPLSLAIQNHTRGYLLDYDVTLDGEGVIDGAESVILPQVLLDVSDDPQHVILQFDWADEANEFSAGWAEAAGDALFALMVRLGLLRPEDTSGTVPDYHFIGHGFGAVVVSEAVERLATYDVPVDQVTYLDPQDFDQNSILETILPPAVFGVNAWQVDDLQAFESLGEPDEYGATVWDNVTFADVYYQNSTTLISEVTGEPVGRPIPNAYNADVTSLVDDNLLPSVFNTALINDIFYPRADRVWSAFYLDTVTTDGLFYGYKRWAQAPNPDTLNSVLPRPTPVFFRSDGPLLVGAELSHTYTPSYMVDAGGAPATLLALDVTSHQAAPVTDPFAIHNGDFAYPGQDHDVASRSDNLVPGWSNHGGGGEGVISAVPYIDPDTGAEATEYVLALSPGAHSRTHNRVYIPETAGALKFETDVRFAGGEILMIYLDATDGDGEEDELLAVIPLAPLGSGIKQQSVFIPSAFRGQAHAITFEVIAPINFELHIDNIRFDRGVKTGDIGLLDLNPARDQTGFAISQVSVQIPTQNGGSALQAVDLVPESNGDLGLEYQGVDLGRILFSDRFENTSFADSGRLLFAPPTGDAMPNGDPLPGDILETEPGFQGFFHIGYTVDQQSDEQTALVAVFPGFSTAGRESAPDSTGAVESTARIQQRLRYLGFPSETGEPLRIDGVAGPDVDHAIAVFNAAVNPQDYTQTAFVNLAVNHPDAPRWLTLDVDAGDDQVHPRGWSRRGRDRAQRHRMDAVLSRGGRRHLGYGQREQDELPRGQHRARGVARTRPARRRDQQRHCQSRRRAEHGLRDLHRLH